ncbi:deleted in lung and esophageal cancer protein 1-like [Eucyclogobius newberryi]|uniref:deleted in lung and esophageal cancer protein 1-like n=1 Tax=Eucyclogobius newberryi TaxID=166745 RepID=UPI003B5CD480
MEHASCSEPAANSHGAAPEKSQVISHVLESIFKKYYTKDILGEENLTNVKKRYYDGFVEDLQQACAEFNKCIQEYEVLESHISQAQDKTAEIEGKECEKIKQNFDENKNIITVIFPVQSVFPQCVDKDLLEMNNLISPWDYLSAPRPKPFPEPPEKAKPDPTRPTVSYLMHTSRTPQDDGYTTIPQDLDVSVTVDPSSDEANNQTKPQKRTKLDKPKPKWKGGPSATECIEGQNTLQKMKDRQNFLRNPRFLPPNAQCGGTLISSDMERRKGAGRKGTNKSDDCLQVFQANPPVLVFIEYSVGQVYEATLELKNMTSASRHVRVIPPTTAYFYIGLGRFPGEGGVVAPGMSCKYNVRFAPDSLTDFQDFIVVESLSEDPLVVPIEARRPPPVLTLPRVLDCGYCLVGGVKFVEFLCQNVGLCPGTFCLIPKHQWPPSNLRSVSKSLFTEHPPFAVSPSLFSLQPGETTAVEAVFFPSAVEKICQVYTIVCDNCQVKDICVQGEGQLIALELLLVPDERDTPTAGEQHDLTAEHFVRFGPCNPNSLQKKKIIVRNNVHLELPFHWQIVKPHLQPLLLAGHTQSSHEEFVQVTDDTFHVSPESGLLAPCQDHEFLVTFWPKELKDYHSVCHLMLSDVPRLQSDSSVQVVSNESSDVIGMEVEVKGSTEPYQVLLEPYGFVVPGELLICTSTRKQFKMWNHSKASISFQWERINSGFHIMEVEPSSGLLEENECIDFALIMTGGKPEKVVTNMICHIKHHYEPVTLPVEVTFKGPTVTISVPSLDFGLLRLGEQCQTALLLENNTQVEASWQLAEKSLHQKEPYETQISVEPSRGILPPLSSGVVNVVFRPHFCQQLQTELELTVENGTGCHLSVQASVQSPQVCLLNCELHLSQLYMGVISEATVTLFNQTLLASNFKWRPQLQGKQASVCEATLEPTCGTLGPNASVDITLRFISHTEHELTEVAALCDIEDMKSPLVLRLKAARTKTLAVSYSLDTTNLPSDWSSSKLLLDFGDIILKKAVTRQLKITNKTAIPAPFFIAPEFFNGNATDVDGQSQKRSAYVMRPLHSAQAKKVEEKIHTDFVSSLLTNGKGAAFFVTPDNGMLGAFQTQTVDVTVYTDMWGDYTDNLICKVGELEPTLIPMQMTVKGCPLYFQLTGPHVHSQNKGPTIRFGTHVSGGDTVSRSLRINNPTTFDIRLDWKIYYLDKNDDKLVDLVTVYGEALPVKDIDGNVVSVRARGWEKDQTSDSVVTSSSSLQSLIPPGSEEGECLDEEDTESAPACSHPYHKKNLVSVLIRPHFGNISDYPYCITPQQIIIPAKGSSTLHVSFTPLTLTGSSDSKCEGKALGFISLDSETAVCVPGKVGRIHGLGLEPLRMNLQAVVKPATMLVQMDEDEEILEFRASAGDLVRQESDTKLLKTQEFDIMKSFRLLNTLEMPLQFTLKTQPPFLVLTPQPPTRSSPFSNTSTGEGSSLRLQPQRSMKVKVAFHCSDFLMGFADLTDDEMPDSIKVIQNSKGERRMRFEQTLTINYINGSTQAVPLVAYLDLASLSLSNESLDFGISCVGKTQMKDVKLFNVGAKTFWESIIESDKEDSHTFSVTPEFGVLRSKDLNCPRFCQYLQISFTPSEVREYRARVVIHSPLVKTPLIICLQGTGSFNGCMPEQQ